MENTTSRVPSVIETQTIVVSAIFPTLSFLSVLLRFRARSIAKQSLMADDWWIVISWIVTLSTSVLFWTFGALAGVNHLKGDIHTALLRTTQCLYANAFALQVAVATVKISILYFYKRIFSVPVFRMIANVVMILIAIWAVIYIFLFTFENDPVSGSVTGEGHQVINFYHIGISQAINSICLDVVVLCLPLYFVFRLHMRTKWKVLVIMIFWLGGFCVVAAILRLVFLVSGQRATDSTRSSSGFTGLHDDATAATFITIEPSCSIIAACLPCYGPLLTHGMRLESMVRSARSMLSLPSRGSGRELSISAGGQSGTDSKAPDSLELHQMLSESSKASGENVPKTKDLPLGWTNTRHFASIASAEPSSAGTDGPYTHNSGIKTTRSFETRFDSV